MLLISSHGRKVLSLIPGGETKMGYDGLNGFVHKTCKNNYLHCLKCRTEK